MSSKSQIFKRLFQLFSTLIIWGAMTLLWAFIWYECYADVIALPFYRKGNWVVIAVYGVILYFVTQFYGGYRVGFYKRGDVIFSGIMSMIVANIITYFQTSLIGRQFMPFVPFVGMSCLDFILIWIWATWANSQYTKMNPPRHLLLIYGGSSMAQSLICKMIERDDKYIIQEAVNVDEGIHNIIQRIDNFESVLICDVKSSKRNLILEYCYDKRIRVYMTPKISDILIRGASNIHLFDTPLLLSRNQGLTMEQRIVKRLMDIVISVVGLLILWPIMILVAVIIKVYDNGPVLYKQTRLTQNRRKFMLYKFRSMIVDAESENAPQLAEKDDNRITPVGKIIRSMRIDELPQLINILKGDMSVVGPRPERPELADHYKKEMKEFDFRLKVKAGLTGYAQILGKYNTTPYDKLKLDLMYIADYSFTLDLKLILQTIKILFVKESTEGV